MTAVPKRESRLIVRTYRAGDDAGIVDLLNAAYPGGWGTVERWRAKHSDRDGFDSRDIYLAELDGRIVGCLHTAMLPIHVADGVTLTLSLDGDLAVHPEARGRSIPEILYTESRRRLYTRGIPLRGGYTETGLWKNFYQPRIGYVSDFDTTVNFKKMLDPDPVRARLLALFGGRRDDDHTGEGPTLEVAITGLAPFRIRLGRTVGPVATSVGRPALRLEADQRVFGAFGADGGGGLRQLLGLWRRRGLVVKGTPAGFARVVFWYLARGRHLMRADRGGRR
jgi:GNAT superfamily N-acetyltransferase